jgi:hypothetical protein
MILNLFNQQILLKHHCDWIHSKLEVLSQEAKNWPSQLQHHDTTSEITSTLMSPSRGAPDHELMECDIRCVFVFHKLSQPHSVIKMFSQSILQHQPCFEANLTMDGFFFEVCSILITFLNNILIRMQSMIWSRHLRTRRVFHGFKKCNILAVEVQE